MTDTIEITGLCKTYRVEGRTVEVLRDLDLTVPAREITVLLGRSGCGKTTLLRLIGGLEKADSGIIRRPAGSRTAFVFQEARLMPWLTVEKNIAFGLKKKDIRREELDQLISLTGLDGFADALPGQLSGGMQQRVALARALAMKPDFILMDEPFAALDHFTREKMQNFLLELHQSTRCGVLFVTHSIDEALAIGDRIVILSDHKANKGYPIGSSWRTSTGEEERRTLRKAILDSIENQNNKGDLK
ncbi:MAG: ABC transporter ATP-binding protein [Oscillospiraceae bacterium]|nr:ABC transporter ATP-binding protein [Oscillospiraceae bacterium]